MVSVTIYLIFSTTQNVKESIRARERKNKRFKTKVLLL
jgi:hypothetical protein